ncbi:hypothetical protein [Chlamydiifrater phoenicopteri]|uniref:hypothetical protein n=1 Tax=Chlamydiifrater phoenicopteri TaxID=2681469 RepID=UPI001BD16D01|nr:hypothetical protein [Chlamydiifrater phoenicopteri]
MSENICFIKLGQIKKIVSRPAASLEMTALTEGIRKSEGVISSEKIQNDSIRMESILSEMRDLRVEVEQSLQKSLLPEG